MKVGFRDSEKAITDLGYRFDASMEKYGFHANIYEALGALELEVDEVKEAIQQRKDWKVREEMLDVANVCLRWVIKYDMERAGYKLKQQQEKKNDD